MRDCFSFFKCSTSVTAGLTLFLLLLGSGTGGLNAFGAVARSLIPAATYPPGCSLPCHGNDASPSPDGTEYPDTAGAHPIHSIGLGFDCILCHDTPEGPGGNGHFDFEPPADVVLATGEALVGASATYDPVTAGCNNVYCHNPRGDDFAAVPRWNDAGSVYCGGCHSVLRRAEEDLNGNGVIESGDLFLLGSEWRTSSGGDPEKPDLDHDGEVGGTDILRMMGAWHQPAPGPTFTGSHAVHFDTIRGPGITECTTCHPENTQGHSPIDGVVMFNDSKPLGETDVCNTCHGVTASTKPTWGGTVACTDCHKETSPANSRADGTGIAAPAKPFFAAAGHGLDSAEMYPVTGNAGAGFGDCEPCHDPLPTTGRHISHTLGDEKRLRSFTGDSHEFTTRLTEQCLDCHLPDRTTPGDLGVDATAEANIHSSAVTGNYGTLEDAPEAFPAYGDNADFGPNPGYQCDTCHDPHGTANIAMVLTEIDGMLGGESNPRPVRLTIAAPEWARESDGVCEACHKSGGDSHPDTKNPGNHNHNQDCRKCHDNHPSSFQPNVTSSSCVECHSTAQGALDPVVDDFGLLSHHVIGAVTDTQCEVCHDTSEHMSGTVLLKDPDNPASSITYTGAASLEEFCLGCHDANGAAGDTEPFNDGGMPADIAAGWAASAHKTNGRTCAGDGVDGCHGSPHGSEKRHLLGRADVPATPPGLVEEEEGFCYQCHPAIETEFGRSSRHDVAYSDQNANGSKIECTNCHNPHVSTVAQPLIDPDIGDVVFSGNETDFCLACHDGDAPNGVVFPSESGGSGYNKSRWIGSKHQLTGAVACSNCHERHGSSQGSLKTLRYDQSDHVTYSHGSEQYALCWQCHDEDKVVRTAGGSSANNAFGTRHSLHVRSEDASCIECHDVHFSYDAGEDGLMSYAYPVKKGWTFSLTTGGTTYTLSSAFRDTGTNRGSCYLSCHGHGHNPETYTGVDADTLK